MGDIHGRIEWVHIEVANQDCSLMTLIRFEASNAIRQKTGLRQSCRVVMVQPVDHMHDTQCHFALSECESPKARSVVATKLRKIKPCISAKHMKSPKCRHWLIKSGVHVSSQRLEQLIVGNTAFQNDDDIGTHGICRSAD